MTALTASLRACRRALAALRLRYAKAFGGG